MNARHITTLLRGAGHYRIPLALHDGDRLEIVEPIYVPSNSMIEGFGYRSRLHCVGGGFIPFVFTNLDGSPSVNVVMRDLRATDEDEGEIQISSMFGTNGYALNVWVPTLAQSLAVLEAIGS